MENSMWQQDRLSEEEILFRAFNPIYPDTTPTPQPDTSQCQVSIYTEGEGETPIS
jgi:hypothetical protein